MKAIPQPVTRGERRSSARPLLEREAELGALSAQIAGALAALAAKSTVSTR
jgi:hypothetical protein